MLPMSVIVLMLLLRSRRRALLAGPLPKETLNSLHDHEEEGGHPTETLKNPLSRCLSEFR